ncbi:MAG: 30S ribosomal protein S6 [Magnetovibrio sp.]|nr:30S ribosomal protein S6 [Magnetovibrio sp.]
MPYYENVFIARQDISPAQVDGLSALFEKVITDAGGSVAKREDWGLRTMAHKIKKNRKGHYVLLNIEATPPALHEMERQMRINEDILRYLTVRVDRFEDGPSAIMRIKDRGERLHQTRETKKDNEDELPRPLDDNEDNALPQEGIDNEQNSTGVDG